MPSSRKNTGEERAQAIFESLLVRNKASIRVTDLSRKEEIQALLEASASSLSPSGLVKEQGHFAGHDLFAEGAITIQDESSQLVAPTLDLQGDEQVLDACAAPGGKTAHIASYLTTGPGYCSGLVRSQVGLNPRKCSTFRSCRSGSNAKIGCQKGA